MVHTSILNVGLAAQSLGLAGVNIRAAVDANKKPSKLLKAGITNIVGLPLLRTQAQLIGSI